MADRRMISKQVDAATGEPLDTITKVAPLEETPCESAGLAEVLHITPYSLKPTSSRPSL